MDELETVAVPATEQPAAPELSPADRLEAAFDAAPAPEPAPEPDSVVAEEAPADPAPEAPTELKEGETPVSLLGEGQEAAEPEAPVEEPAAEEPKAEEAAPAEEAKAEEEAKPEEPAKPYEIALPEGFPADQLDQEAFGKFKEVAESAKLDPAKATELLALYKAEAEKLSTVAQENLLKSMREQYNSTRDTWRKEVLADENLGGARVQTTMLRCREVIEKFGGTPEQRQQLYSRMNTTAMGDSLPLVRLLSNVWASTMKEGAPVPSQPRAAQAQSTQDLAKVLFDS